MKTLANALAVTALSCFQFVSPALSEEPPFSIGAIYALSSWAAPGGIPELTATQMAVDEINSAGGVRGRKLSLIVEDTQSDLRKAATAAQKLASVDKVAVIVGPNWAEFSEVAAPIAQGKQVVMLSASGYTDTLTKNRPYVFTTLPAHHYFTAPVSEAIANAHHKRIEILKSDNSFYESLANATTEQLRSHNAPIAETQSFSNTEQDFRSVILKLKNSGTDAVYLALLQDAGLGLFLRQARELGFTGKIYGTNGVLFDSGIAKQPEIAEGIIFFNAKVLADESFSKKFKARTTAMLMDAAPRAYDNIFLLRDAIERCGFESVVIRKCLEDTNYDGMAGKIVFDKDHHVIPQQVVSELMTVRGGSFVPYGTTK